MPSELLPDSAVKAIQDSVVTKVIEIPEGQFATRQVFAPPLAATPTTINVNTLTGLIEYVKDGPDTDFMEDGRMVQVIDPENVAVLSGLFGRYEQRREYLHASAEAVLSDAVFSFGQFYDSETFNIKLQSVFADVEDREKVLRVVGNIKEENVRQANDDGVTQNVTARSGIARVEEVPVPNPVLLVPYRTFREVAQPASNFVLRLRQGREGSLPTCALFEADGGQWKLTAIKAIADYLKANTEGVTIIA